MGATDTPRPTPADAADALTGAYQILFQRIHEEVVAATRRITDALRPPNALRPGADVPAEVPSCRDVQQGIVDLIERVAGDAVHLPPMHERHLSLYVMVAMADEVFLRAPYLAAWGGREEWAARPLEQQLFRTHSAGERFFELLDDALASRTTFSKDLLAVFLTALALGFCGRFPTGSEPEGYRARIAERLGYEATGGDDDARADAVLFQHSARVAAERASLPNVMNGVYPIVAVVALWLVAGFAGWQIITFKLGRTAKSIDEIQVASPPEGSK